MLRAKTRKWVAIHVAVDVAATCLAWLVAYALRFHEPLATLVPVTKGVPDVSRYLLLLPLIALLWPPVLYFHGLYQIRRGRSRIDETFAILFSVLLASALTLGATLYVRVYYRFQPEVAPLWEYSQAVFALFVLLDVLLISFGRAALRAWQERQWAGGREPDARARGRHRRARAHRGRDAARAPPRSATASSASWAKGRRRQATPGCPVRRAPSTLRARPSSARRPTRSTSRCRSRTTLGSCRSCRG